MFVCVLRISFSLLAFTYTGATPLHMALYDVHSWDIYDHFCSYSQHDYYDYHECLRHWENLLENYPRGSPVDLFRYPFLKNAIEIPLRKPKDFLHETQNVESTKELITTNTPLQNETAQNIIKTTQDVISMRPKISASEAEMPFSKLKVQHITRTEGKAHKDLTTARNMIITGNEMATEPETVITKDATTEEINISIDLTSSGTQKSARNLNTKEEKTMIPKSLSTRSEELIKVAKQISADLGDTDEEIIFKPMGIKEPNKNTDTGKATEETKSKANGLQEQSKDTGQLNTYLSKETKVESIGLNKIVKKHTTPTTEKEITRENKVSYGGKTERVRLVEPTKEINELTVKYEETAARIKVESNLSENSIKGTEHAKAEETTEGTFKTERELNSQTQETTTRPEIKTTVIRDLNNEAQNVFIRTEDKTGKTNAETGRFKELAKETEVRIMSIGGHDTDNISISYSKELQMNEISVTVALEYPSITETADIKVVKTVVSVIFLIAALIATAVLTNYIIKIKQNTRSYDRLQLLP